MVARHCHTSNEVPIGDPKDKRQCERNVNSFIVADRFFFARKDRSDWLGCEAESLAGSDDFSNLK
jgi:hypothetical protein